MAQIISPAQFQREESTSSVEDLTVRCLSVPLQSETLLIANTAVAEVTDYAEPALLDAGPEWLLGLFEWRGIRIPMISFEALRGEAVPGPEQRARVVVFNTLTGHPTLPFIATVATAIPGLSQVAGGEIESEEPAELPPGALAQVRVAGAPAFIPDLETIEDMLAKHGVMSE